MRCFNCPVFDAECKCPEMDRAQKSANKDGSESPENVISPVLKAASYTSEFQNLAQATVLGPRC